MIAINGSPTEACLWDAGQELCQPQAVWSQQQVGQCSGRVRPAAFESMLGGFGLRRLRHEEGAELLIGKGRRKTDQIVRGIAGCRKRCVRVSSIRDGT